MSAPENLFKTAPVEVRRFFETKRLVPTYDWRDIAPHEHAFSFTIAKTTGFDVLEDINKAVNDAITNRVPFEDFKTRLKPVLEEKGWWGRRVTTDPKDGRFKVAQLGSPRRLRTIYQANMASAYAAGEWERIERTKRFLPYLRYTLSTSENKRLKHTQWAGTILPVDHPWWRTHYPPNGWGCKCGVEQISKREAERSGYDGTNKAPLVKMKKWKNKRNGLSVSIPEGIDPGWHTNAGLSRGNNMAQFLSGALDDMSENRARLAVIDMIGSILFRGVYKNDLNFKAGDYSHLNQVRGSTSAPVAILSEEQAQKIGLKTRTVLFSTADSEKQNRKRLRKDGSNLLSVEDYVIIQSFIDKGDLYQDGARDFVALHFFKGRLWTAVFRKTKNNNGFYLKSFRPTTKSQERKIRVLNKIK